MEESTTSKPQKDCPIIQKYHFLDLTQPAELSEKGQLNKCDANIQAYIILTAIFQVNLG